MHPHRLRLLRPQLGRLGRPGDAHRLAGLGRAAQRHHPRLPDQCSVRDGLRLWRHRIADAVRGLPAGAGPVLLAAAEQPGEGDRHPRPLGPAVEQLDLLVGDGAAVRAAGRQRSDRQRRHLHAAERRRLQPDPQRLRHRRQGSAGQGDPQGSGGLLQPHPAGHHRPHARLHRQSVRVQGPDPRRPVRPAGQHLGPGRRDLRPQCRAGGGAADRQARRLHPQRVQLQDQLPVRALPAGHGPDPDRAEHRPQRLPRAGEGPDPEG